MNDERTRWEAALRKIAGGHTSSHGNLVNHPDSMEIAREALWPVTEGSADLRRAMYAANSAVRNADLNLPKEQWLALLEAAERAKANFQASRR